MTLTAIKPLSTPLIRVGPSAIHGLGAFAASAIPRKMTLGFYEGKRYSPDVLTTKDWDDKLTYLFVLSDGSTIDAGRGGNATRHLNHSCAPNCEAVEDEDTTGKLVLRFYALRAIRQDEELFIDYRLQADETALPADYPCQCGAPTCRGTMLDITPPKAKKPAKANA